MVNVMLQSVWQQVRSWRDVVVSALPREVAPAAEPVIARWAVLRAAPLGALLIACTATAVLPRALHAQAADSAPVVQRSTLDGVYTAAQALRGRDVYAGLCQSCHTVESHTGAPFRNNWVGRPLSDLFTFIVNQMPQNEPGSLSPEEYTLALSYILRMNGLPAGSRALPSDVSQLDQIRVELPAARPAGGPQR